jgi:hypothetical protein
MRFQGRFGEGRTGLGMVCKGTSQFLNFGKPVQTCGASRGVRRGVFGSAEVVPSVPYPDTLSVSSQTPYPTHLVPSISILSPPISPNIAIRTNPLPAPRAHIPSEAFT